ncbi:YesL family protein [Streptococcus caprae]|uniref:YesL family protein n=1 Tax=Streptococcus caprae TaxID=1640501 RepID=A0ABV8CWD1_9STRE
MQDKTKAIISAIFSLDSGFMKACERIFDFAMLNLLFVVSCLPVVTIGVAKLSLFTCLNQMAETGHLAPWADYSQAFKRNFREGIKLGLVEVLVIGFCLLDIILLSQVMSPAAQVIKILSFGVLILVTMTSLYLYPIASRYQLGLKELVWKSFLLASLHTPKTLLMLAVLGGLFLAMTSSTTALLGGLSLLTIIGWVLLAYLNHHLVRKALDQSLQS